MHGSVRQILLVIFGILLISVFILSSQTGEESGNLSMNLTVNLVRFLNLEVTEYELHIIHILVRKFAHFSIFMVIGLISKLILSNMSNVKLLLINLVMCLSDECHQILIPGRGPSIRDIIIDMCGCLVGIGIAFVILYVYRKYRYLKLKRIEESID